MLRLTRSLINRCGDRRGFATASKVAKTTQKSDRDVFGMLSYSGSKALDIDLTEKSLPEDPDGYDQESFDLGPRKNAYYYKYEITKYARQGPTGLRRALELFHTMKSKDRLTPTIENFSPLIYGCARAGFTKKAFELYTESLKYRSKPTRSTVTCLINACAECPFPDYGLARLNWFMDHLKLDYSYELNLVHYNSAIKAYGKLGQLERASDLVRDMIASGLTPNTDTFNMLLIGCGSDKKSGALFAFKILKRLKYFNMRPNLYTYNTLLRCIRDCGLGSAAQLEQALGELPAMTTFEQKLIYKEKKEKASHNFEWLPLISDMVKSVGEAIDAHPKSNRSNQAELTQSDTKSVTLDHRASEFHSQDGNALEIVSEMDSVPNLLSDDHLNLMYRIKAIIFSKIRSSSDRLSLFGGMRGFLSTMVEDDCQPDKKTFGLLLDCIPQQEEIQNEYYDLASDYKIKKDLVFYDLFIKHIASKLNDKSRLKRSLAVLDEMHKDMIRPNISTFESIALACDSFVQANRLIRDINLCGFTLSDTIIENFFTVAIIKKNFSYISDLIELCSERKFSPKKKLVEALERVRVDAYNVINLYERKKLSEESKPKWLHVNQIKQFDRFNALLDRWLRTVNLSEEEHPWAQFNVESVSKKDGFIKFVQEMKALEAAKTEAMRLGNSKDLGNLMAKAKTIKEKQLIEGREQHMTLAS